MRPSWQRAAADLALLISILFLPWWLAAALALAFTLYFDLYFEVIGAGFLTDALYGIDTARFAGVDFAATLASGAALLLALYARAKLRYYR